MPSANPIHGLTAYEKRLGSVDIRAAMSIFDRSFALDAFGQGLPAKRGKNGTPKLDGATLERINRSGHAHLARACLSLLLSNEGSDKRPERRALLHLIRQIRDGAEQIVAAADTLAEQARAHRQETGAPDIVREGALQDLALALYGNLLPIADRERLLQQITLRPVDNPFSGNRFIHGLTNCAALFNEAETIRKRHRQNTRIIKMNGVSELRASPGNKADYERDAFIRDLAEIYEHVTRLTPAAPNKTDRKPPFMRYIERVFREFRAQTVSPIEPHSYMPPSIATVRAILNQRKTPPHASESFLPGQ